MEREGSTYRVDTDAGEIIAVLRGRLKHRDDDRVVAGDVVDLDHPPGGRAAIRGIHARRSLLARRAAGARSAGRAQAIAANVDQVVVVAAARDPEPNPRMLDRFLVIAESNALPAVLVVNKVDLNGDTARRLEDRFRAAGYPVVPTSTRRPETINVLRGLLRGRASVLTGPSGVGKSSLVNALEPGRALRIGVISAKRGTGKHTTRAAVLVPLSIAGGYVVDTPGLREVGTWGVDPDALGACFPEFRPYLDRCRFDDCRHMGEPECAVRSAADQGLFDPDRLVSYTRIYEEVSVPSWSSARRRAR